jgi:hypothetical protein
MKKTGCMLLFALISSTLSMAQKSNHSIPGQVAMQFAKKFSNIEQVEWRESNKNYEAQFNDKGVTKKVLFSNAGQ